MKKYSLLALVFCLLLGSWALAETQTITLKNGQTITGEVIKTAKGYEVKALGGVVAFPFDEVASVTAVSDPDKEYKERLSKIDPNNVDQHIGLAEWALEKNRLDIAKAELDKALALQPNNEKASLLMRKVRAASAAERTETPVAPPPVTQPVNPAGDTLAQGIVASKDFVSDDDMYKIRLFERSKDDTVTVEFRNKVVERFIEAMRESGDADFKSPNSQSRFRAMPPNRQLQFILDKISPDDIAIMDDILIKSDPRNIREFRNSVWPVISQNCGQLQCHGAPKGKGGFKLYNIPARTEKSDYTNFLILTLWQKDGKKMIDRGHNELSLLLQYSLPGDLAKYKHPKSARVPLATSDKAAPYRKIESWIASLAGSGHPNYRTTYQPPVGRKLAGGASSLTAEPTDESTTRPATSAPSDPFAN